MKAYRNTFTLMEVLVVIAIISILAALVVSTVLKMSDSGRKATAEADISMIYKAIQEYKFKFDDYPSFSTGKLEYNPSVSSSNTNPLYLLIKTQLVSLDQSRFKEDGGNRYFFDPFGKPYYVTVSASAPVDGMTGAGPIDSNGKRIYIYAKGTGESDSTDTNTWIYLKGGK